MHDTDFFTVFLLVKICVAALPDSESMYQFSILPDFFHSFINKIYYDLFYILYFFHPKSWSLLTILGVTCLLLLHTCAASQQSSLSKLVSIFVRFLLTTVALRLRHVCGFGFNSVLFKHQKSREIKLTILVTQLQVSHNQNQHDMPQKTCISFGTNNLINEDYSYCD